MKNQGWKISELPSGGVLRPGDTVMVVRDGINISVSAIPIVVPYKPMFDYDKFMKERNIRLNIQ